MSDSRPVFADCAGQLLQDPLTVALLSLLPTKYYSQSVQQSKRLLTNKPTAKNCAHKNTTALQQCTRHVQAFEKAARLPYVNQTLMSHFKSPRKAFWLDYILL